MAKVTRLYHAELITICILLLIHGAFTWKTVLFCDLDLQELCHLGAEVISDDVRWSDDVTADDIVSDEIGSQSSLDGLATNMTVVHITSTGNFITDVELLSNVVAADTDVLVLVALGSDHVTNTVTCVAEGYGLPAIVYSTSHHRKPIFSEAALLIHPDPRGLAEGVLSLLGEEDMLPGAFIICEDTLSLDGFLDVFLQPDLAHQMNASHVAVIPSSISDRDLRFQLLLINDNGYRLIIVHANSDFFHRIAHVASDIAYFDDGFAWLITEKAMAGGPVLPNVSIVTEKYMPRALLAVDGYETNTFPNLIESLLRVIRTATISVLFDTDVQYDVHTDNLTQHVRALLSSGQDISKKIKRRIQSDSSLFDAAGRRKQMQYRLLNLNHNATGDLAYWSEVGTISDGQVNLKYVIWPGHSIFGPLHKPREYLTIVTAPAEPFIYARGPVDVESECVADTACLKIFTEDRSKIISIIDSYKHGREIEDDDLFEMHCCEGLVVDVLHSLAIDLKIDFLLYFMNVTDYGHYVNDSWTGMVGDVTNGIADVMAGAVTISSDRLDGLSFTEAFYFSSFNMIASSDDRYTALLAFLNPFHYIVWLALIGSATVVAITASLFEWNSPFGLNPWGKRRKKNYTLGSALTMVYSIWFGHTVITKSPKSWPSKFLQNCWSALAIFVLASYTANLAAFLAGSAYSDGSFRILDSQLSSKRVGVVKTSAVEAYIKTFNTALHTRFRKYYVNDIEDAFFKLRTDQLDLYMDDSPILEYALSRFDDNCSIKYASHHFGENSYAFGLPKGSLLKVRMDKLVLTYVEMGFVEDLKWRYLGRSRQCNNKLIYTDVKDVKFGLKHTGGLFIILLAAIGVSICLLIMEHFTYFIILPRLRKKPLHSIWRSRNLEYFSQRLYKSINSEKIDPITKVFISKVKERKFQIQSRLKRQTVSVPASLTRFEMTSRPFTSILNSLYKNYYETHSHNHDADIYTLSDGVDNLDQSSPETNNLWRLNSQYSVESCASQVFDNPVFEAEEEEFKEDEVFSIVDEYDNRNLDNRNVIEELLIHNNVHVQTDELHVHNTLKMKPKNGKFNRSTIRSNVRDTGRRRASAYSNKQGKHYETWPSPQTKRKRSLKKNQNDSTVSFSSADRAPDRLTVRPSSISGYSIIQTNRSPPSGVRGCRKCSSVSLDGYSVMQGHGRGQGRRLRFNVKDNRMKSSLRNHAMARLETEDSHTVDSCAVEALSKEDLLILWKRSEIELQTKLNRMLHQNNHLRHLVHIVQDHQNEHDTDDDIGGSSNQSTAPLPCINVSTRL